MNEKYSVDSLNGVRVIAAVGIVLFHYNKLTGTSHWDTNFPFWNILHLLYSQGGWLVELFFLISGICFFKFYSEKIMKKDITVFQFLKKRYLKLWPLYAMTSIAVVFCQIIYKRFQGIYFENNFEVSFKQLVLNILGIARSWVENDKYPYNAPAWYLSVLFFVYIIFSILCALVGKSRKKEKNLITVSAGLVVIATYIRWKEMQFPIINVEMCRGIQCFFMGGLIHFWLKHEKGRLYLNSIWIELIMLIGLTIVKVFAGEKFHWNIWVPLALFPFLVISCLKVKWIYDILKLPIFEKMNTISYEMYLVQYPVFIIFKLIGDRMGVNYYSKIIWLTFWLLLIASSICLRKIEKIQKKC